MTGADIAAIVGAISTLVSSGVGVWLSIRAKKWNVAFSEADKALKSVVAGVEVWGRSHPNDPRVAALKSQIQSIATATGAEDATLRQAVIAMADMLEQSGVFVDASTDGTERRAIEAVKAAQNGGAK